MTRRNKIEQGANLANQQEKEKKNRTRRKRLEQGIKICQKEIGKVKGKQKRKKVFEKDMDKKNRTSVNIEKHEEEKKRAKYYRGSLGGVNQDRGAKSEGLGRVNYIQV